jgi:hypothetical protein
MKLGKYFRCWILGSVFIALLGIQLVESTHHHESAAIGDSCPVCQVVAHTPLDLMSPAANLIATALLLLFHLCNKQKTFPVSCTYFNSYYSRAPPQFTA